MRRLILVLCTLSLVIAIPIVGSGENATLAVSDPGCDGSDLGHIYVSTLACSIFGWLGVTP